MPHKKKQRKRKKKQLKKPKKTKNLLPQRHLLHQVEVNPLLVVAEKVMVSFLLETLQLILVNIIMILKEHLLQELGIQELRMEL
jgi:hypothetical protein